jgi:hypothetical protein
MMGVRVRGRKPKPAEERFWPKVQKTETCWLWIASTFKDGYGQFHPNAGSPAAAHRFAYELLVGPIPKGTNLDHLCRVRHCVNPDHLEPVTNRENILRGESPPARQARQTHCQHGHPLAGENLTIDSQGARICLTCRRANDRKRYAQDLELSRERERIRYHTRRKVAR